MKRKIRITGIIAFFALQILVQNAHCQQLSLEWYNRFGLENWDYANDFIRLSNGNFIVCGSIKADAAGDSLTIANNSNGWIACIDSLGVLQWQKTLSGKKFETVTSIAERNQEIIISGIFQDTVSFDSINLVSDTYMSGFYGVLDFDGNLSEFNKIGENAEIRNITISSNNQNRSFMACSFSGELDFTSGTYTDPYSAILVCELSTSGTLLNSFFIKGTGKLSLKNSECSDSLLFVSGSFSDTLFIGDSIKTAVNNIDGFLAVYNFGGQLKWIRIISGNGNQEITDFEVASDGKIALTGFFENNAFLDEGVLQTYGSKDMFVALLDSAGNLIWSKNIGSVSNDQGYSVKMNSDNDIYVSGSFTHIIAIPDENGNPVELESFSPYGNSFIAKYNEAGILKASYNLPGTSEDYCQGVEIDESGKITVVGNFFKKLTLNGIDGTVTEINSLGDKDVFMLHFDDMCKDFSIDAGNDTIVCPDQPLVLLPGDEYNTYIWEPAGEVNQPLEVNQPGIFHLTATNQYGCIAKDSLMVFQGVLPQVYAGTDTIIEPGQNLELLQSSVTDALNHNWTTSGDGYFYNPDSLHTVYSFSNNDISEENVVLTLTATNVCGSISDSLDVTIIIDDDGVIAYPNPSSDLVTLVCEEGLTIESVIVTNQTGYVYLPNQTVNNYFFSFDLSPYPPGSYMFHITLNSGIVTKIVNKI